MNPDQHTLLEAYKQAGGMPEVFQNKRIAHLVVGGNQVYSSNLIPGLELECETKGSGIEVNFRMKEGFRFKNPVNLCFGVIPEEGVQEINVNGRIEDNAELEFLAYCVFPNAVKVKHLMQGNITIGNDASFKYHEVHYHGENGGILVSPKVKIIAGVNSYYQGDFYLLKGRAGKIDLDYEVEIGENSRTNLLAKILASGNDEVYLREKVTLRGRDSKGQVESIIVGKDNSTSEVVSELIALKEGCIGHIDCIETILDQAQAKATPLIQVTHRDARITHEAAIGSLSNKQLETIMAKGLTPEQAVEVIVRNMLR